MARRTGKSRTNTSSLVGRRSGRSRTRKIRYVGRRRGQVEGWGSKSKKNQRREYENLWLLHSISVLYIKDNTIIKQTIYQYGTSRTFMLHALIVLKLQLSVTYTTPFTTAPRRSTTRGERTGFPDRDGKRGTHTRNAWSILAHLGDGLVVRRHRGGRRLAVRISKKGRRTHSAFPQLRKRLRRGF